MNRDVLIGAGGALIAAAGITLTIINSMKLYSQYNRVPKPEDLRYPEEGAAVEGVVSTMGLYTCIVHLKGFNCMAFLHIRDNRYSLREGDEIEAKVIKVDKENLRVHISTR